MSGLPLVATEMRTSLEVRFVPNSDIEKLLKFSQTVQIGFKLSGLLLDSEPGIRGAIKRRRRPMPARITFNLNAAGELEMWLNPEGRDVLVKELQGLSERWDHVHFGPKNFGEVEVSDRPYQPDDKLLMYGKILFRTDAWDAEYFPHVLDQPTPSE
jgi:hypothetical protein